MTAEVIRHSFAAGCGGFPDRLRSLNSKGGKCFGGDALIEADDSEVVATRSWPTAGEPHLTTPRQPSGLPGAVTSRGLNKLGSVYPLNQSWRRARGWRGTGARGRAARGPVEPHGSARAPVGCPATGPAGRPALEVIQRIHTTSHESMPSQASVQHRRDSRRVLQAEHDR